MKTIEDHIQKDKEILADPSTSEPMRHHIEDELHDLRGICRSSQNRDRSRRSSRPECLGTVLRNAPRRTRMSCI